MKKGEVWMVTLPSTDGHEQYGLRPAIVVADTKSSVIICVPCTSNVRALRFPYTVSVEASGKNGLHQNSVALVLHVRAIDKKRLEKKIGVLEKPVLQKIDRELRKLLKL